MAKDDRSNYKKQMNKIDPSKVEIPKIVISDNAKSQLLLAFQLDPYHQGKQFRIHISGKGCDGFSYETFFDKKNSDDLGLIIDPQFPDFQLILTPFCAYYLKNAKLDFVFNPELETEGFLVTNLDQKLFEGKFWRQNPERTPELF